jgi:hypothetical protein
MAETTSQWVEVWNCAWIHEAQFLKSVLEAAGIEALLPDEHTLGVDPGLVPALGGVRLLVHADDFEQARELIESESTEDSAL